MLFKHSKQRDAAFTHPLFCLGNRMSPPGEEGRAEERRKYGSWAVARGLAHSAPAAPGMRPLPANMLSSTKPTSVHSRLAMFLIANTTERQFTPVRWAMSMMVVFSYPFQKSTAAA